MISFKPFESYKFRTKRIYIIVHPYFHNFGLTDLTEKYLHKGSLIYLEGKLKTRTYDDKEEQKKYVTEIIGEQLILFDKK